MAELLEDLSASFSRHLRAEGRAPRTAVLYGQSIRFYGNWLTKQGLEPTVDNLTRDLIREWLAVLHETNAAGTVLTRWRGLRRFCGWLVAEEILDAHPMKGITQPTPPAPPVPVLTDADLAALIKACKGKTFRDRRDEAVIRLLLDCGVRVSELVGLRVSDVDLDAESAIVTGKGSKVRAVYFGARTSQAIDRYLRERRKQRHAHLEALFIGERGATTDFGVREILKVRGAAAGITDRLNPHRFRHTFAHDFLLAGGQERDLKRLAGWTSDAMLERYGASAADARAKEAATRLRRGDRV
ncbi:tyrosine-type recombinase/integrase [Rhodococcus jostii]|uniref:tyrosine-type recombinase/integrase n=1 Tax=Rhodococcus jostii TaxID=132919 RepID=UPI003643FE6A